MNLHSEVRGTGQLIVVEEARIDAAVAIQFKDAMRALVDEAASRIVLDLRKVQFIDSSGLGAIVAAMKLVGPQRKLELAALNPTVRKVFTLTRLDTVFTIHETAAVAFSGLEHAS